MLLSSRRQRDFNNGRCINRHVDHLSTVIENFQAETALDARVHSTKYHAVSPLTPLSADEAPLMNKIRQLNAALYRKKSSPIAGRKSHQPIWTHNHCSSCVAGVLAKLEELVGDLDRKIGGITRRMDRGERLKEIQKEWGQMARVVERIFLSIFVVGTAVFVFAVTATAMPLRMLPPNCTLVDMQDPSLDSAFDSSF